MDSSSPPIQKPKTHVVEDAHMIRWLVRLLEEFAKAEASLHDALADSISVSQAILTEKSFSELASSLDAIKKDDNVADLIRVSTGGGHGQNIVWRHKGARLSVAKRRPDAPEPNGAFCWYISKVNGENCLAYWKTRPLPVRVRKLRSRFEELLAAIKQISNEIANMHSAQVDADETQIRMILLGFARKIEYRVSKVGDAHLLQPLTEEEVKELGFEIKQITTTTTRRRLVGELESIFEDLNIHLVPPAVATTATIRELCVAYLELRGQTKSEERIIRVTNEWHNRHFFHDLPPVKAGKNPLHFLIDDLLGILIHKETIKKVEKGRIKRILHRDCEAAKKSQ